MLRFEATDVRGVKQQKQQLTAHEIQKLRATHGMRDDHNFSPTITQLGEFDRHLQLREIEISPLAVSES